MERISTGMDGMDDILQGGFIPERNYLIRGGPGAGKTTIGLSFLTANPEDSCLYITLEENPDQIRQNAEQLGIDTSDINFLDLSPSPDFFSHDQDSDVFSASDSGWEPIVEKIMEAYEEHEPDRVLIDSLTQLNQLSPDIYQFRKKVLALSRYLLNKGSTILMVSDDPRESSKSEGMAFLADGVISINVDGIRKLEVDKLRGSDFDNGEHHLRIKDNGPVVYPTLKPNGIQKEVEYKQLPSGIPELDSLLNGGIEAGTSVLISGPTGVGKTTTSLQFLKEAVSRGQRASFYTFEEAPDMITQRAESLNIPLESMRDSENLSIHSVESLSMSTKEFAQKVIDDVQNEGSEIVVIDSLEGLRMSFHSRDIDQSVRAIVNTLKNMGVTVILLYEMDKITGDFKIADEQVSHFVDSIIFMRYLEIEGELKKAIGVLKKRTGDFERTLREIEFTGEGIRIGEPMENLRGILSGQPEFINEDEDRFESN